MNNSSAIEIVRDLHDKIGIPVVLVGMSLAEAKLKRHKHIYDRLLGVLKFETFNKTGELLHEHHDIARFKSQNEVIDCCVLTNYQNQEDYEGILNMIQNIGKILTQ